MKAFVGQLSEHVGGLIRCGEDARLVTGEFALMVLNCGRYQVLIEQRRGAPLEHVIPEDAFYVGHWYMGVPRTAAHPHLAKLFVNMVLSEEGQALLYEMQYLDHHALPGSRTGAEVNQLVAKGIPPLKADVKFQLDHPELAQLADELDSILREKR
jgi:ABC-type Fe3+ transport system substrate-binding protein